MKRVNLIAPNLNNAAIVKEIGCIRPMRDGCFRIEHEQIGSKHLFHCYGFGGSGWTMLPSAIHELFKIYNHQIELKDKKVCVVGGGCMGLIAALMLDRKNVPVELKAISYAHLPSHNAGGLWAPASMQTAQEHTEYVNHMGYEAYRLWVQSLHEESNFLHGCARRMPFYVGKKSDSGLDVFVKSGLIPPPVEVELHFDTGAIHKMFEYKTLFIDTFGAMQTLMQKCCSAQISMKVKQIHSWEEITEDVIFNCSGGLGAPTNDPAMIPVLGHLCLTKNPRLNEMQYMILTHIDMADDNQSGEFYWMPKQGLFEMHHKFSGVFGGSFIHGVGDKLAQPEEFENIKARMRVFFTSC